jgi:flagellar L-ring protein precursor FlgH
MTNENKTPREKGKMQRIMAGTGILLVVAALCSCSGIPSILKNESTLQPAPQRPPQGTPPAATGVSAHGSLWKEQGYRSLFRDLRARQVGDLVTVNIVETSKGKKKADTKTSRDSSIDAGISNALGWETKIKNLTSFGKEKVRKAFENENMFKANMANEFTGSGETNRDETMTASITAVVIDVTPEGNLFIRGTREVKLNNETQFITLTGFVRPEDISPDNTVLSSYIGDARIAYTGSGSVSDKQRPGWLMRLVDFIWPF